MSKNTPIYTIAKNLEIDNNRIILACKTLGIEAKGATKRLRPEEVKKVKHYFNSGKNVSQETIDINKNIIKTKTKQIKRKDEKKKYYFPNRLIRKL